MHDSTAANRRHDEVIEFMRTRRSVPARVLAAPGPDEAEIRRMVEIAMRVPDHGKLAPWRFVRYDSAYCERLGSLCEARAVELNGALGEELRQAERERFTRAPVVIAVVSRAAPHPKIPEWEQVLSSGAAAMSLLIAANAMGYDAQWLTEWVAYDEAMAPALGLRPGERIVGFLQIGTRTLPKTERERPVLEDVFSVMKG
ncbi:MAG: nitroreductase [Alphaproteobacteria bacterium]|nr:MAG: nitroreductase [Alphaproteobacteria bacterium]